VGKVRYHFILQRIDISNSCNVFIREWLLQAVPCVGVVQWRVASGGQVRTENYTNFSTKSK